MDRTAGAVWIDWPAEGRVMDEGQLMTDLFSRLGRRAETMRYALDHIPGPNIVETGCARIPDNWAGDGMSTVVFGEWAAAHGGHVWSVDIDPTHVEVARRLTAGLPVTVVCGDSIDFLADFAQPCIDLLYLDSLDYPDAALRDLYGGREDPERAAATLDAMDEDEIARLHHDLIQPSQDHCSNELIMALPMLHEHSVVLIDDAALPGGGKARMARRVLLNRGWRCAIDAYQTVWVNSLAGGSS